MTSDRASSQTNADRSRFRHMRAKAALIGATALMSAVMAAPAVAQAPQRKPNILFIMGDDIGWMQPSIYTRAWRSAKRRTSTASAGRVRSS